ncbi:hypothetical protein GmHk_14G041442 [Glycine max]|nr:hypothetical protein GmHk_14G041442 [Glycine max]
MKWKMACTKKTGQMMFEVAKEIVEKIASRGSFVAHGRQDVLTAAIRQPEHPGHVRSARASVMIKKYFGPTPRTSHTSSSMAPEDLEQLMQKIRDQLEESITEKVTRQLMLSFNQIKSSLPGYLGRLHKGSTTIHNISLLHDQVKVGVEEVRDADAPILGAVGPAKPVDWSDHDINDPLYLMTLTIPQLFRKPLHMTETSMGAGNADVYGFLEPQSIQRSGESQFESESYIKNWMHKSKRDVYLGAYCSIIKEGCVPRNK